MNESLNQLPLNFKDSGNKTFQQFITGENKGLIESLQSFSYSKECLFYLWGDSGSGKTHILHAFIDTLNDQNKSAVVISVKEIANRQNVSLIEMFDYICIDEVDRAVKQDVQEEALFFWINEVKQANKKIILSSQISNHNSQWQLPDLKSRLQSGRTHEIIALDRDQALQVFKQQAVQKAIVIDAKIEKYLTNNCPMNVKFLSQLLQHLDQVTLIQKKQVTIPLLKKILQSELEK